LPEVAGLRRLGFLHLLEEEQPSIVLGLNVALVSLG
jgi:hypothetical protein